ncbi:MAG: TROVE domain-containing protein [Thermonemataceae bacterium]
MKFNTVKSKAKKIKNHAGGVAYTISPELELYTAVVTASLDNNTYENAEAKMQRIYELLWEVTPEFIAQLAIYTREQMHLRSIPIVLVVELAKLASGSNLVSRTVNRVVKRADEITELLAYYQWSNLRKGNKKLKKLSKQIQKGLAMAFNHFDEYQFAKYNRAGEVQLRDALFLVHPKAKDEAQQAIFDKIAKETLTTPYTWEVALSQVGQQTFANAQQKEKAIRAQWEELIDSGKLGYMALLRNLRNILGAHVSHAHAQKVADTLADPEKVCRSKQFPFRFLAAYREIAKLKLSRIGLILTALEKAVQASIHNVKGFGLETRVLIASDVSGSMCMNVSQKSAIQYYDIGLVLSMLMNYRCKNVITGIFGDRWKQVSLPQGNVLENVQKLRKMNGKVGYSTNGHLVITDLIRSKTVVDKVMFFTDVQMWNSGIDEKAFQTEWLTYKREVAPEAKLYLFDLAGYGQVPIQLLKNEVHLIAGWSDKIFDVLAAVEEGEDALATIHTVEL